MQAANERAGFSGEAPSEDEGLFRWKSELGEVTVPALHSAVPAGST